MTLQGLAEARAAPSVEVVAIAFGERRVLARAGPADARAGVPPCASRDPAGLVGNQVRTSCGELADDAVGLDVLRGAAGSVACELMTRTVPVRRGLCTGSSGDGEGGLVDHLQQDRAPRGDQMRVLTGPTRRATPAVLPTPAQRRGACASADSGGRADDPRWSRR